MHIPHRPWTWLRPVIIAVLLATACDDDGSTDPAPDTAADDTAPADTAAGDTEPPGDVTDTDTEPHDGTIAPDLTDLAADTPDVADALDSADALDLADTLDATDVTDMVDTIDLSGALHVSTDGRPEGSGSEADPVDTVDAALALRQPGQPIVVHAGTYTDQLYIGEGAGGTEADPLHLLGAPGEPRPVIDRTGSTGGKNLHLAGDHIVVEGFEVRGSANQCVDLQGTHLAVRDLYVHDCVSHGVMIRGSDILVERTTITDTVRENAGGTAGGWGSALKVQVGGERVVLRDNVVAYNWGEGIAATRGREVTIEGNLVVDNFSVNIYVDNSVATVVRGNLAVCNPDSGFERDGNPASAISIGEESYEGWGAQLADVTIVDNITAYCRRGLIVYTAEVAGGGLDGALIAHNTFWGSSDTALSIPAQPAKTRNVLVANNLVQQPEGRVAVIEDRTGIEMRDNFWVGTAPDSWRNADGPGDLTGDPGLLGTPDRESVASFRLAATAAAREAADPIPGLTVDLDEVARPAAAVSMGALEYVDPTAPSAFDARFAGRLP